MTGRARPRHDRTGGLDDGSSVARPRLAGAARAVSRPRMAALDALAITRLQRSAGNRAVATHLAGTAPAGIAVQRMILRAGSKSGLDTDSAEAAFAGAELDAAVDALRQLTGGGVGSLYDKVDLRKVRPGEAIYVVGHGTEEMLDWLSAAELAERLLALHLPDDADVKLIACNVGRKPQNATLPTFAGALRQALPPTFTGSVEAPKGPIYVAPGLEVVVGREGGKAVRARQARDEDNKRRLAALQEQYDKAVKALAADDVGGRVRLREQMHAYARVVWAEHVQWMKAVWLPMKSGKPSKAAPAKAAPAKAAPPPTGWLPVAAQAPPRPAAALPPYRPRRPESAAEPSVTTLAPAEWTTSVPYSRVPLVPSSAGPGRLETTRAEAVPAPPPAAAPIEERKARAPLDFEQEWG